jgi:uncharacterized protein YciI
MMTFVLSMLCVNLTLGEGAAGSDSLFFVFLNTNPDRPVLADSVVRKLQEGHIANIGRLHSAGKLLAAGPFAGGGGLFIMKTRTQQETWDSLQTDPAIKASRFNLEFFPLQWVYGGYCPPPEGNTMVDYAFARVHWGIPKPSLPQVHDSVLVAIDFPGHGQGVVVLGTPMEESARQILVDMLPPEASYTLRRVWIARGTFCEQ